MRPGSPYVVNARLALATLGSLLIIILLAVPSANAYFRLPALASQRLPNGPRPGLPTVGQRNAL
jgi:hypothetical protein